MLDSDLDISSIQYHGDVCTFPFSFFYEFWEERGVSNPFPDPGEPIALTGGHEGVRQSD